MEEIEKKLKEFAQSEEKLNDVNMTVLIEIAIRLERLDINIQKLRIRTNTLSKKIKEHRERYI